MVSKSMSHIYIFCELSSQRLHAQNISVVTADSVGDIEACRTAALKTCLHGMASSLQFLGVVFSVRSALKP
jgi:hypothetical protein